jgi:hypothetical protein
MSGIHQGLVKLQFIQACYDSTAFRVILCKDNGPGERPQRVLIFSVFQVSDSKLEEIVPRLLITFNQPCRDRGIGLSSAFPRLSRFGLYRFIADPPRCWPIFLFGIGIIFFLTTL